MARSMMTRTASVVLVVTVCLAGSAYASNIVTFQGCPRSGVEAGCIVLQGSDGQTYNISAANPRPNTNDLIVSGTGNRSHAISYCGQGVVLENIQWYYTGMRCSG
jgi:hypothetical protein